MTEYRDGYAYGQMFARSAATAWAGNVKGHVRMLKQTGNRSLCAYWLGFLRGYRSNRD